MASFCSKMICLKWQALYWPFHWSWDSYSENRAGKQWHFNFLFWVEICSFLQKEIIWLMGKMCWTCVGRLLDVVKSLKYLPNVFSHIYSKKWGIRNGYRGKKKLISIFKISMVNLQEKDQKKKKKKKKCCAITHVVVSHENLSWFSKTFDLGLHLHCWGENYVIGWPWESSWCILRWFKPLNSRQLQKLLKRVKNVKLKKKKESSLAPLAPV